MRVPFEKPFEVAAVLWRIREAQDSLFAWIDLREDALHAERDVRLGFNQPAVAIVPERHDTVRVLHFRFQHNDLR